MYSLYKTTFDQNNQPLSTKTNINNSSPFNDYFDGVGVIVYYFADDDTYKSISEQCVLDYESTTISKFYNYVKVLRYVPIFKYSDGKFTLIDIHREDGLQLLRLTVVYLAKCYKLDVAPKDIESMYDYLSV